MERNRINEYYKEKERQLRGQKSGNPTNPNFATNNQNSDAQDAIGVKINSSPNLAPKKTMPPGQNPQKLGQSNISKNISHA
jgi:hypothetical protein